jgi:phosphatidylserine synthase
MELNWMANHTGLAVAFLCLLVFGFFYNLLVERFQKRTQRYTAELVVGGVLVTVFTSAPFIGLENALIVLMMFGASGFFMTIGSWIRAARDDEEAKKIQRDTNK